MTKPRTTTDVWKPVGNILVPSRVPEEVGLGCPKCDDHIMVVFTRMGEDEEKKRIEAFVKKHTLCGVLDTLECHSGRLEQTGQLKESE
jgi:hypothetical protein